MRVPVTLRGLFFKDPFFHLNWDKCDKLKEHVLQVSEEIRRKDEHALQQMKTEAEKEKGIKMDETLVFPKHWMVSLKLGLTEDLDLYPEDGDEELIMYHCDKNSLMLCLDVHHFRPDEIKIVEENGMIVISAFQNQHWLSGTRTISRQFRRTFALPEGTTRDDVCANLSSDGILFMSIQKLTLDQILAEKECLTVDYL